MTTKKKATKAAAPKGSKAAKDTEPRIRTARFEGPASDWGDEVLVDLDAPAETGTGARARAKK